MKKFLTILLSIIAVSAFLTSCNSSQSGKKDPNSPEYYYGTWVTNNSKIEVTFRANNVAKCIVRLGGEPIEFETEWAVSENTGAIWKDRSRGSYTIMTPDGHLYGYDNYSGRYTDMEVYMHRK